MTEAAPSPPQKQPNRALLIAIIALGGGFLLCTCLGVVSAIAIPAFINYVKRSKVAEADANVEVLATAVRRHCEETGAYPPAAGPLPEVPTNATQMTDFRAEPTFARIGFDPGSPVYFSYAIEPASGGVDAVAYGDLDGDGLRSERRIHCGAGCACGAPDVLNALE